jgi:hypothetical protein
LIYGIRREANLRGKIRLRNEFDVGELIDAFFRYHLIIASDLQGRDVTIIQQPFALEVCD